MSLGFTQGTGDFAPYIKFDAKAGRIFRSPNKEAGETKPVDLTNGFVGAFDFANIEIGWMDFPQNAAPVTALRPLEQGFGDKPTSNYKWKQGFRVRVVLPSVTGVFDMMSNANATKEAFNEIHDKVTSSPEFKSGKVPVLAMTGVDIQESQSPSGVQRNYKPMFAIQQWIDRPASFNEVPKAASPVQSNGFGAAPQPAPQSFAAPASTGNKPMTPPAPASFG